MFPNLLSKLELMKISILLSKIKNKLDKSKIHPRMLLVLVMIDMFTKHIS